MIIGLFVAISIFVTNSTVIEKITGTSISDQLHSKILAPYNLKNTFLYPDPGYPTDRMAHSWWDNFGSSAPHDVLAGGTSELPMAGLFSSV